ncbi:MAG: class I SAM-dependent methyltransferase [Candidatus Geothermincolia bacterium]
MREELLALLRCPACAGEPLYLEVRHSDPSEVREGTLRCAACAAACEIDGGIPELRAGISPVAEQEVRAWEALLPVNDFTPEQHAHATAWNLALPCLGELAASPAERATWQVHGDNLFRHLEGLHLHGAKVLELGAGRCWASAAVARMGADVIALDVMRGLYLGLSTADLYLPEIFFERISADMHELPLRDCCLDLVFATASLHHACDPPTMLREAARVLVPGGSLLAVNERVRTWLSRDNCDEVEGVNEQSFSLRQWIRLFRRAGFRIVAIEVAGADGLNLRAVKRGRPSPVSRLRERERTGLCRLKLSARVILRTANRLRRALEPGGARILPGQPGWRYLLGARLANGAAPESVRPGIASDRTWCGRGWHEPELMPEPASWTARRASLLLRAGEEATGLTLRLGSWRPGIGNEPTSVRVSAGGMPLGELAITEAGWADHRLELPASVRGKAFRLTLVVVAGCYVPRRSDASSEDARMLGVACARAWTD